MTGTKRMSPVIVLLASLVSCAMILAGANSSDSKREPIRIQADGATSDEILGMIQATSFLQSQKSSSTGSGTGAILDKMTEKPPTSTSAPTPTTTPERLTRPPKRTVEHLTETTSSSADGSSKSGEGEKRTAPSSSGSLTDSSLRGSAPSKLPGPSRSQSNSKSGSQEQQQTTTSSSDNKTNTAIVCAIVFACIGGLALVLFIANTVRRHLQEKEFNAVDETKSGSPKVFVYGKSVVFMNDTSPRKSSFFTTVNGPQTILQFDSEFNPASHKYNMNSFIGSMPPHYEEEEVGHSAETGGMMSSVVSSQSSFFGDMSLGHSKSPFNDNSFDSEFVLRNSSHSLVDRCSASTTYSTPEQEV